MSADEILAQLAPAKSKIVCDNHIRTRNLFMALTNGDASKGVCVCVKYRTFTIGSHCSNPTIPELEPEVEADHKTKVGDTIQFSCAGGERPSTDPDDTIQAKCLSGNQWEGPDVPQCVKSKA